MTASLLQAGVLEIASAKLAIGRSKTEFEAASTQMHQDFLRHQSGFIGRQVWMQDNGQMGAVLQWKDMASAQASLSIAMQNKAVQEFVAFLEPGSYQMQLVPVIQTDLASTNS